MAARWIVFLVYFGVVALLGWQLIRRARAAWRSRRESAIGKTGIHLFVFAVLSLIFAGAVKQVLISGARLVSRVLVSVPFQLVTEDSLAKELARSGFGGDLSASLSFVAYGIRDAIRAAHLPQLPYVQIVAFAALFVILTKLLVFASTPEEAHHAWLKRVWDAVGVRRRQNSYLSVVLLAAAYLSAAALMALPEVEETASMPESVAVDKLRERLTGMQLSAEEMAAVFPEDAQGTSDPFAELDGFFKDPPELVIAPDDTSAMAAQAPRWIDDLTSSAKSGFSAGNARRAELAHLWRGLRSEAQTRQRHALEHAALGYENENLNRIGARQTIEHFRAVVSWYETYTLATRESLARCQQAVRELDKRYQEWGQQATYSLRNAYHFGTKAGRNPEDYALPKTVDAGEAKLICQAVDSKAGELPHRAEAGANLKPVFSAVGGWLIGQESLQLALIVGMIGFGLLGAAISSIVRGRKDRRAIDEPLVSNLAAMVIRGVSAAVVVFLTVKGGLALFGASETGVNPYVVLLTCFAAAVYSQDAWARVRKNWGGAGEPPPGDPPAPSSEPPPTPTDVPPPPANG